MNFNLEFKNKTGIIQDPLIIFLLIFFLLINISCTMNIEKVDLIVHNARIYTLDKDFTVVESFAIKDKKIIRSGTSNDILGNYSSDFVIDAGGKTIFPGFVDAHCHFTGYGLNKLSYAELSGTKSFNEIITTLKDHYNNIKPDWVLGRGWDQNDWEVKQFPDNKLLDEAFPDVPVMLLRIDGHAALANTAALNLAGINNQTKVEGGEIILQNNIPTGILVDNAIELVRRFVPKNEGEEISKALLISQSDCFKYGLTTVADAGLDKSEVETIDSMQRSNELLIRVYAMLNPTIENVESYMKNGIYVSDKLSIRSVKLYADGALGSRGAKLIDEYSDSPGNSGLVVESEDYYRKFCDLAYEHGFQVNTHAIGDSAVRMMLNIYSEYLKGKNDLRWRTEHAQIVDPTDVHKFGDFSIVPSVQATHATSDMYWAETRLGKVRIKSAYIYQELLLQNGWIPNGTDFPVEEINPVNTYFAAVFRKDREFYPVNGFQPENSLSREEALRSITIWAAKSCFMDTLIGSIEPGKFADFVVMDRDIYSSEEKNIPEARILETWINGERVYKMQ